jgi:outer membrane protein OmpA-like peptidoglycan-associated protein
MGALTLVAVAMMASPVAYAQENNNRDENGKVVRGPYMTNRFGDNWFIGAGGGINIFINEGYHPAIGPSVDANFGKWFTPSAGIRVGYQGLSSQVWADQSSMLGPEMDPEKQMYAQKFGYMYIHGDFLWNFSNAVSGYKETRFWDFVPYLHAGYYRSYGLNDNGFADNEIAGGAGLLHNLRLAERLDLIIDMRATVVNGRSHGADGPAVFPSVTAGLAVDLGFPAFIRSSTVIDAIEIVNAERVAVLETAVAALELANAALLEDSQKMSAINEKLSNENEALKQNLAQRPDYEEFFSGLEPAVLYFEIGKAELGEKELKHLDFIASNLISKADNFTQLNVTLMGSADSNTGGLKRNKALSQARSKYVCDLLTKKYGISPDRLVVKSEVVKAGQQPEMSRAVIISF